MKIKKRSIVTFLLLVAMVATMCVGYVSAHGMEEVAATSDDLYHNFWLMCPAGGTTDLATEQKKEIDTSYAYYDLKPVTNNTGLSFYVNVRSQNGATIVGYAEERTGEGAFFVNYRPGYGILNEYYRPSAQTDNDATKPVYIEGKWRP